MGELVKVDFTRGQKAPNYVARRVLAGLLAAGAVTGLVVVGNEFVPHESTVACAPAAKDIDGKTVSNKADTQLGNAVRAARAAGVSDKELQKYVVGENVIQQNILAVQDGILAGATTSAEATIPETCITETHVPILGGQGKTYAVDVHVRK